MTLGLLNILRAVKRNIQNVRYVSMLDGSTPVFTSFGEDVYASDIVQSCIRIKAQAMGKLKPQHIRTDPDGLVTVVPGSLNRLLRFKPNPYMTTTDFLEKITYLREINKNVFIYPAFREIPIKGKNGYVRREYTGFYPLNPMETEFIEDGTGAMYVKFTFQNGYDCALLYSDLIHWRKDYGANELMGGDRNGRADNEAMLKMLKTDHTILQGMENAVKATSAVKGIIKTNTIMDLDTLKKVRKEFEEKIKDSNYGIVTLDLKDDFIPITLDPKLIDQNTMEFIIQRILNNYGVPLSIYNGDFNEEQYQAFYERNLEGDVISLNRCFSSAIFTERELEFGNEISFNDFGLAFTNMANKIKAADILSSRGTLTDNQILQIFGYPPFPGGNVRKQSLNYIDRELASEYQLSGRRYRIKEGDSIE